MPYNISVPIFRYTLLILILTSMIPISIAESTQQYENPMVFQATDILPGNLLVGEDYQIHSAVYNDGIYNRYQLSTTFGPLTVEGRNLLSIRIHEIQAIRQMEELKRTEVYGTALKNAALSPLKFAKSLVLQPIDTLSNAATGVGKWFGNIGHSMWGGGSEHEEGTFKTLLGFDTVKRAFAKQFDVDPYSSYPALQERLNEVSWTAFAGSLTVKVAFSVIPGVGGTVVGATSFSNGMKNLIADKTPAELKELNEEKLQAMMVHESLAEVFLEHPQFSPTQKTFLVGALENMPDVANREVFIQAASLVQDEGFAKFRRRQAEMMAAYHTKVNPVKKFIWIGGTPILSTKNGTIVIPVPVDHVVWTRRLAQWFMEDLDISRKMTPPKGKELWMAGTVSALAKKNFEARGWIVKEHVADQLTLE
jgi:hypothetical protein